MRAVGRQRTRHPWRWTAALGSLAALGVGVLVWLAVVPTPPAEATTFTVNSTADPGAGTCDVAECTLREAIDAANLTTAADSIVFDIPGSGPHTITLGATPLADITADLTIDGGTSEVVIVEAGGAYDLFTISGAGVNVTITNLILDGSGTGDNAIVVEDTSDANALESLEIRDWTGNGIFFEDTVPDGTTTSSDNNDVMDNWIHDNTGDGVELNDGTGNTVTGNQISANVDGINATDETNLTITDNELFGNSGAQITIDSVSGATILRNDFVAGSDGIVLEDSTADPTTVLVGGSAVDRNRFRGITLPGSCTTGAADCYVQLNAGVDTTVNATHNDWGTTETAATGIPTLVCHQAEGTCGGGLVNFADPEPPGGSPVQLTTPTPTPSITPTRTPTLTATPTVTGTPPTSTPTPTVTGTPPTATPTHTLTPTGGATSTPTTGPTVTIPLATGCNFQSSTYPDNTTPATLAAAVSPQGSIRGIWSQQPAPIWRGYNPLFAAASDMLPVDFLDVIAICLSTTGTFTRPEA
jgi:CSLREA domain-containing protein